MMPESKQRATRRVIAALIESGLTSEEMRQLLLSIAKNKQLLFTLQRLLDDGKVAWGEERPGSSGAPASYLSETVDAVVAAIDRQRMSKSELLELLSKYKLTKWNYQEGTKTSVRRLVETFIKNLSPNERADFVRLMLHGAQDDPYLEGILKRK